MRTTTYTGCTSLIIFLLVGGCATSMTPKEFTQKLPKSTSAKYYDQGHANKAVADGACKVNIAGRKYTAPIGMTVYGDLVNAAAGIDEWVQLDKGNAYAVNNFEWVTVSDGGATQLIVYFDTMLCN